MVLAAVVLAAVVTVVGPILRLCGCSRGCGDRSGGRLEQGREVSVQLGSYTWRTLRCKVGTLWVVDATKAS